MLDGESTPLPGLLRSPGSSLRSVQKTCGLFDTGLSDDDDLMMSLALEETKADLTSIDTSDLFSGGALTPELPDLDSFYEHLTDLSPFLPLDEAPVKLEAFVSVEEVIKLTESQPKPIRKRRRFSSAVTASIDHDYTIKKAKPSDDSDTDTEASMPPPVLEKVSPQEKYIEKRNKNNVASKISRASRRQKYKDMEVEAKILKVENEHMAKRIVEMENLAKVMKDMLVKKMAENV